MTVQSTFKKKRKKNTMEGERNSMICVPADILVRRESHQIFNFYIIYKTNTTLNNRHPFQIQGHDKAGREKQIHENIKESSPFPHRKA
jgi:hypothetical protein